MCSFFLLTALQMFNSCPYPFAIRNPFLTATCFRNSCQCLAPTSSTGCVGFTYCFASSVAEQEVCVGSAFSLLYVEYMHTFKMPCSVSFPSTLQPLHVKLFWLNNALFVLQLFLFCNRTEYMYRPAGIVEPLIARGLACLCHVQSLQSSPNKNALYLLWFPILFKYAKCHFWEWYSLPECQLALSLILELSMMPWAVLFILSTIDFSQVY